MFENRTVSRKNAVPLVEFMRLLRNQSSNEGRKIFPRRYNGRLATPSMPMVQKNIISQELKFTEEVETLKYEPQRKNWVRGKRRRSPSIDNLLQMKFLRSPFACEILTKSSKGMYSSTYVDIELKSLGLHPLVQEFPTTRKETKLLIGVSCCYLRLGTALVVSGCIVEVNITDSTAQIVPEKGLCLDVEWVSLKKLYCIPDNIRDVRRIVSEKVYAIIKGEMEDPMRVVKTDLPGGEQWEEIPLSQSQDGGVVEEAEDTNKYAHSE
ncbi:hypothetical protein TcYC6_0002910 [Trypanosoma cruzi]|uniref:Uncharacterized protein n=1 Tax=Trypanosoma cruzi TaxID=5693 RepID=A0A7J6Y4W8_TRYCR|nr:hypothetical protein ECC02_005267 [Trypanosoma cruzi]KAF8278650.1 hypothetical protein TcYC6_0002910 [Trypanosoma cruzi]